MSLAAAMSGEHTGSVAEHLDLDDGHRTVELPSGAIVEIRPTSVHDAALIQELYDGLSERDRYRRFFSAFEPTERWCEEWASVAERGGFGLLAVLHSPDGWRDRPIADAAYAMRADGDGDLAITVAADRRGWLGGFLLDLLVDRARRSGVANLQADVLLENRSMLALLRHRGAVHLEHADSAARVTIPTDGEVPSWPPLEERPCVVVELAGTRWAGEDAAERAGLALAMCAGPNRRRGGCPALEGAGCPLVDGADAVIVVRDPTDRTTQQLIAAHCERNPSVPVFVRGAAQLPADLAARTIAAHADVDGVVRQVAEALGDPSPSEDDPGAAAST